jgi:hypothetical protein
MKRDRRLLFAIAWLLGGFTVFFVGLTIWDRLTMGPIHYCDEVTALVVQQVSQPAPGRLGRSTGAFRYSAQTAEGENFIFVSRSPNYIEGTPVSLSIQCRANGDRLIHAELAPSVRS